MAASAFGSEDTLNSPLERASIKARRQTSSSSTINTRIGILSTSARSAPAVRVFPRKSTALEAERNVETLRLAESLTQWASNFASAKVNVVKTSQPACEQISLNLLASWTSSIRWLCFCSGEEALDTYLRSPERFLTSAKA